MNTENNNRRNFIKKSCLTGACLCGFATFLQASPSSSSDNEVLNDPNKALMQEWISTMLASIDDQADDAQCRKIVKKCSVVHYNQLDMDHVLEPYVNNIDGFMDFLKQDWGWKITYNADSRYLIADENKDYCVCPLVNKTKGVKSSILCYCSEGIAELMFSKVFSHPVEVIVISSIQRGDQSCQYRINF